ncbi:hypothetical protein N7510_011600 [Penicillium lagena]|uniref:uncharacterized protein n=1 Tax=Penicillium lagena TaxID=94218 RepID=UPI00253FC81F|nr:uncharacterized protein N7510_011600 [Penicillium lagena]KAJ5602066.1 hypothetical protein N7510_011600 [Penicillium lagena]
MVDEFVSDDSDDFDGDRVFKDLDEVVRHLRPPKSKNRVYNTLHGLISAPQRLQYHQLEEYEMEIIWEWAGNKDAFFQAAVESTNPPEDPGESLRGLNSICCLLGQMKTQNRIDKVRGRLLQYFLALFVERHISDVRDVRVVTRLVIDSGLIAPEVTSNLENNLRTWLAGGRCYMQFARALGGAGVLIHLPLIGSTSWESHSHLRGTYGARNYELLRRIRVPEAADEGRLAPNVGIDLNAHQLVDRLVQDLSQECGVQTLFVVDAADRRQTRGSRLRRGRQTPYQPPQSASQAGRQGSGHARRSRGHTRHPPPNDSPHTSSLGDASLSGQAPLFSAYPPLGDDYHSLSSPQIFSDEGSVERFSSSTPGA